MEKKGQHTAMGDCQIMLGVEPDGNKHGRLSHRIPLLIDVVKPG
jgi:hypothetical protein